MLSRVQQIETWRALAYYVTLFLRFLTFSFVVSSTLINIKISLECFGHIDKHIKNRRKYQISPLKALRCIRTLFKFKKHWQIMSQQFVSFTPSIFGPFLFIKFLRSQRKPAKFSLILVFVRFYQITANLSYFLHA